MFHKALYISDKAHHIYIMKDSQDTTSHILTGRFET